MSQRFWPIGEGAQADYEALRKAVLAGELMHNLAAARFARRGLAGLIADWPVAEPLYTAMMLGAQRPAWTPYADPRLDALAAAYELIFGVVVDSEDARRIQR
ncbi:MAG TPA: hypothetical protein VFR86_18700 [Burkholderiaceae bacterium]|nr:hypothetical protein [Burkholderiaceae bacterium]